MANKGREMTRNEAIALLRGHSIALSENWSMTPEGRIYKERFNEAISVLEGPSANIEYGCHCDLDPGDKPDGCVIDEGNISDCRNAEKLIAQGKGRNDCEEWRPITIR